ncbi:MAG: hypothetical protein HXX11_22175 [Desulfuromonadales bacterium]|nr:hypothetical protein [Desulfuromonadales bacterium]
MQLTLTTSLTQTQVDFSQLTLNQATKSAPQQSTPPSRDRIELSDEARRPHDREHAIHHLRAKEHDQQVNPLSNLLRDILGGITGIQISDLKSVPTGETGQLHHQGSTLAAQQASLSVETTGISFGGSITTSDGSKVAFDLDFQVIHASANAAAFNLNSSADGSSFSFAGSAAELSSTSFSFSLSAEVPDGTPINGKGTGTLSLKDERKEVRQTLKPLLNEFFKETGMPSGKDSINQILKTIA